MTMNAIAIAIGAMLPPIPTAGFFAPLADAGAGAVNLTLGAGAGSATFTRATTARTILASGLIGSVASGVARATYTPAGVYLGYLNEPAATNLQLWSEDWSNAVYLQSLVTVNVNATTAPDGANTGNKLVEAASSGAHGVLQSFTKAASVIAYTWSVWVKAAERTWVYLTMDDGTANNGSRAWFNVGTGVVGAINSSGYTTPFGATASRIEAYTNGWYRCIFTATAPVTTTVRSHVDLSTGDTVESYLGVSSTGLYVWGAQFELAQGMPTTATSYIPTTTVAVTRNADSLIYPKAGNIFDAAGTIACEFNANGSGAGFILVGDSGSLAGLSENNGNAIAGRDATNTATTAVSGTLGDRQKGAMNWALAGNMSAYINGGNKATAAYDGTMNVTDISICTTGGSQIIGAIKNIRIWKTALTDAQIAAL